MCGIAGVVDFSETLEGYEGIFIKMQDALIPRGPDQRGLFVDNNAALIHTRLSVVDLENGRQPMRLTFAGEDFSVAYNGELYNTEEIRRSLILLGHTFRGHSDTEVLLHAYAQWKEDCVHKFNGIFAFAVWESKAKRLFFARDRIGVKPLFYTLKNGAFYFASEIKALLAHPKIDAEIDVNSIASLMLLGPAREPSYGVFCGINEVRAANCGYFSEDGLRIFEYWHLTDGNHTDTFVQTAEKVRTLVIDAIERQLVSDVPVGTFLSGGLDSSVISSVANSYFKKAGKQLHTFSVDYKDNEKFFTRSRFQPDSDKAYIEKMNEFLGATHHRILFDTDDIVDALKLAVDARDLPGMADIDSSLLLFCREVKNHVTVALSGECADEIFGGYPWFRDKEIRDIDGYPWSQSTLYRSTFLKDCYAKEIDALKFVDKSYRKALSEADISDGNSRDERRMKEMVTINLSRFMQTLLDRKDRMSMYSGLEVRVPFCDYRIAEYMYRVPWEMKNYKDREKGLLREAMIGILPDDVLWRKKSPYPKTHNPAYLNAVASKLREIINDKGSRILEIADKDALIRLVENDESKQWFGQLMTRAQTIAYFLQTEYWLKKYNVKIK